MRDLIFTAACCATLFEPWIATAADLLTLDNGIVKVGIDAERGAAITWLSSKSHPGNMVNVADPGRLIQQSYYAGNRLDRRPEGQNPAWSPWTWNPIQGGGVGAWARATTFRKEGDTLFSETTPMLWDMPNEAAQAVMRQWTRFEPQISNAVVVKCEFISRRAKGDRWGGARMLHQELPACYFTRSFSSVRSYLGNHVWRPERQPPGPPWGKATPPRKAMAVFDGDGQGVAVFSPASTLHWNFGPHGRGLSDDPAAAPCMHVAPLGHVSLGPTSVYRYRYWLLVGNEQRIAQSLDLLWTRYSDERAEMIPKSPGTRQ